MRKLNTKDEVNRILANEISNLKLGHEDSRKHCFSHTSEQSNLQYNSNLNKPAIDKSKYEAQTKRIMIKGLW